MHYHVPEKLNADLSKPAVVHSNNLPWTPSQTPGVERRFLERDGARLRARHRSCVTRRGARFRVMCTIRERNISS